MHYKCRKTDHIPDFEVLIALISYLVVPVAIDVSLDHDYCYYFAMHYYSLVLSH